MKISETSERLVTSDPRAVHGFKGSEAWPAPLLVARSDEAGRADQNNPIKASEYLDEPAVIEAKMRQVAQMIRASRCCIAYTGAGLSRTSGIPDYASKARDSVVRGPTLRSGLDALPTPAHHALAALERAGLLSYYVQQNHDGLPQKAGFPQEKMNEIHGAWFDPSNPVVNFSGNLRGDLFADMLRFEKKADLCLCLGTSLSGMNADRVAVTPAERSLRGRALGTVIINLQQTRLDASAAVRVWAKLDEAMLLLARELSVEVARAPLPPLPGDQFTVPYDHDGVRSDEATGLDLRPGAAVRVAVAEAPNAGARGEIVGRRDDGHFLVRLHESEGPVLRVLGTWWITAAMRGAVPALPLVNDTQTRRRAAKTPR